MIRESLQRGISFINGVANSKEDSLAKTRQISLYANGANTSGIYNFSNSLIGDLIDCGLGRLGCMTPPSRLLRQNWDNFINSKPSDAKFLQLCHSGGATHVKNALLSSPKHVRERIIVLAIAPAEIIPKKLCYDSYNYMSRRDIVTHLDFIGKIKYGNQLQILKPHPDAPLFDHDFLSPTFAESLERHIKNYFCIGLQAWGCRC